ncbi:MAG: pilin [Candidatus Falkowbacteria bacterium]
MKQFKKIGALIFLSAYLIIGFGLFVPSQSQAATVAPQFTPQVSVPGSNFQQGIGLVVGNEQKNASTGDTVMHSDLLARYINSFYTWGLSIVGVIAVLMLMAAGLIWLSSAGDSGRIGSAKKIIEGVFLGTLLLVGSWFLLNTINPNLVKLPALEMIVINKTVMGCCLEGDKSEMTTGNTCRAKGGIFDESKVANASGGCEPVICCIHSFSTTNSSGQSITTNNCYSSNKDNCNFTQNTEKCDNLSQCNGSNGGTINCNDVNDGDHPTNVVDFYNDNQYCYNSLIYYGPGKDQEPCGLEPYSKCDKDDPQSGKSCVGGSGGRSCSSGLWCCKFNADGTRINKT